MLNNLMKLTICSVVMAICCDLRAQRATPNAYVGTATTNYVRTWDALAPEQNDSALTTRALKDVRMTTQYVDGLGRPLQTVIKQGSLQTGDSARDLVSTNLYDSFGRETIKYLPFAANNAQGNASLNDGKIKANPFDQQSAFMQQQYGSQAETWFYSESKFEPSPLGRVQESYAPGNSWAGTISQANEENRRSIKAKYWLNNTADSVRIWNITDVTDQFGTIATTSMYAQGLLSKNLTADEHNKQVIEFKDKSGNVILKKVQLTALVDTGTGKGHHGWLSIYYIYDNLNRLRAVIQPEAVKTMNESGWTVTTTMYDEQCFRYEYDEQNRMIKKKVPGAGEVWMVYDARDRLVLMQDANMRSQNKWLYTQYDHLNRPYATGLWTNSSSRSSHAAPAGTSLAYPDLSGQTYEELTRTYYDDYSALGGFTFNNNFHDDYQLVSSNTVYPYAQEVAAYTHVKGYVTGTKVKVLGTANTYLTSANFYDKKGRLIQAQATNINGYTDVTTTQYSWSGQPLVVGEFKYVASEVHDYDVITKLEYDDLARLSTVSKKLISNIGGIYREKAEQIVLRNEYDQLGQLKKKVLAPAFNSNAGLESLIYDYNIRGWMLGMNRAYLKDSLNSYFGFDLGYEKANTFIAGSAYANPQFNGNIEGMIWRSKGDAEKRKYDFTYDAANRILTADFNQYTSGSFNKTANVDFTMRNMSYDANGNILSMSQKGLKLNSSPLIDSLIYSYQALTNKLAKVTDRVNDANTRLGDFHDGTNGLLDDYNYDDNGNMILDNNKGISSIFYNHLNLPDSIVVTGKGTIKYTYDAAGNKLKKTTRDLSASGKTVVTVSNYMHGGVYESRTTTPEDPDNPDTWQELQFFGFEEGRIRLGKKDSIFQYDYFLKDHLGNVRAVITEERDTCFYPPASMETALAADEQILYANVNETRVTKPVGYPTDNYTVPNDMVARVKDAAGSKKVGPSIVLKVMAGDKFNLRVSSYYKKNGASPQFPVNPLITELLALLNPSTAGITTTHGGPTLTELQTGEVLDPAFESFLSEQFDELGKPKAYVSWILLDERFKLVAANSGFETVGADQALTIHTKDNMPIDKNGYLYIYVSNETPNVDVYFDNLQVTHIRGQILEETHYYPFGLTMSGISSSALSFGGPENKIKFQEQEFAHKEFSDGSGLEMYEFKYRMHDPQIGRFWQIDPLADKYVYNSTYAFSENQVISYRELEGLEKVLAIFYHGGPFGGAKTTTPEKAGGTGVIYNDTKRFAESTGKGFAGTVIAPGANSDNSVKTANDFIKSNYEDGDLVVIYGYSYGGDAAVELSKSLNEQGKKVDLLVTVDNSDGPGNFTVDTDIPENVNTNLNVYQDKPSGTTRANGEANTADDPKKTNVINRNVSSPDTTHGNIQEKNKTLIENVINFFIQQYNPPKK